MLRTDGADGGVGGGDGGGDDRRHLAGPRPRPFRIDVERRLAGRSRRAADRRRASVRDPRTRRALRRDRPARVPLNTTRIDAPSVVEPQFAVVLQLHVADDDDRTQVVEGGMCHERRDIGGAARRRSAPRPSRPRAGQQRATAAVIVNPGAGTPAAYIILRFAARAVTTARLRNSSPLAICATPVSSWNHGRALPIAWNGPMVFVPTSTA